MINDFIKNTEREFYLAKYENMKKLKTLTKILLIVMISISLGLYMATDTLAQLPASEGTMKASTDSNGQVSLTEYGKPILRYNYQMVYETDAIS